MDESMKQLQQSLIELETEAEHLLLARNQVIENDKMRNWNREALTALRKRARTTKTSVPSPFDSIMKDVGRSASKPLVKEICATCGNHNSDERTWMMFPGSDVFASIPFHAAHTVLETDQEQLDYEAKKLQSYVKEKSFIISEKGALADKISPSVLRSLVNLTDKREYISMRTYDEERAVAMRCLSQLIFWLYYDGIHEIFSSEDSSDARKLLTMDMPAITY